MPFSYSRSPLNKRPVQLLLLLTILALLFVALPRRGSRNFSTSSQSYGYDDLAKPGQEYEAALVVASQRQDDTTWLRGRFQAWRKSIYVVDDPHARLTVPVNKGRESMVFLTYIIDNYDKLENVTIFIHAERYQWHNDDPDYDGQRNLARLNISYIQDQGYANLRCAWILGCPAEIHPLRNFGETDGPPTAEQVYKESFEQLFPDATNIPGVVGSACCAQIAVFKETIRSRSKEDYVRFRRWLIDTELADDLSGRVMEYSWHIIFGKDAVFCPDAKECYCKLYGICDLECPRKGTCNDRYTLPEFSTLPEGWPEIGWSGEQRQLHEY